MAERRWLLDTSALLAYLNNEREATKVARVLPVACIPFMALSELYYLVWREQGERQADTVFALVTHWGTPVLFPDDKCVLIAGRFKAKYRLGIADSYIAAVAAMRNLTLLTKDPDFRIVTDELPVHFL